jgi:hypothetical protein
MPFASLTHLLLQQRSLPQGKIVVLCLGIVGVVLVGMVIVQRVKRKVQQGDEAPSAGFSLSDLRALHKAGKISTEEFEKAKAKVVEAVRKANARQEAAAGKQGKPGGVQIDPLEGRDVQ